MFRYSMLPCWEGMIFFRSAVGCNVGCTADFRQGRHRWSAVDPSEGGNLEELRFFSP